MSETTLDKFDREIESLTHRQDVVAIKPSPVESVEFLTGARQTWMVRSFREANAGDHVFLHMMVRDTALRVYLPPAVMAKIYAQKAALEERARKKAAQQAADTRKARGIVPGFLRKGEPRKGDGLPETYSISATADEVVPTPKPRRLRRRRVRRKAVTS